MMKIWTRAYHPFIMGGDVNAPSACEVEVSGPYDIGRGMQAYLAVSPNGKTFVAESVTGAIVGPTLDQVREDVRTADPEIIEQQMEYALKEVKKAYTLSQQEFWQDLKAI
jgi:hypothetical protein